ncbi:MAG: hypothetical protein ACI9O4_002469 [Chitinophagales bacterium]|jgi:hypothetical protein
MNKVLLVLIGLLAFADFSFAQNNLTVFSEDGLPFYLILNGIRQNEQPETNVRMEALNADYYASKIIFNDASLGEIEKKFLNISGPECNPCDVTYKIKYDKKGNLVMKAYNFTPVATALPPPTNVTVVNYNTRPMPVPVLGVQVTETTTTHNMGNSDNVNVGVNVGGFNMGVNVNVNDGFGNSTHTSTTTTTTVAPARMVVIEEPSCPLMGPGSFSALLSSMDKKSFDEEKLAIAKQATGPSCLMVSQVKKVMDALEWEDNKLDYAKYAYSYCIDQHNYFQVNDAFEWDSSTEDLDDYLNN